MIVLLQHRASTHLGGVEKEWYKLDFLGRAVSHKITHKPSTGSALSEVITQTYDTWDRPYSGNYIYYGYYGSFY